MLQMKSAQVGMAVQSGSSFSNHVGLGSIPSCRTLGMNVFNYGLRTTRTIYSREYIRQAQTERSLCTHFTSLTLSVCLCIYVHAYIHTHTHVYTSWNVPGPQNSDDVPRNVTGGLCCGIPGWHPALIIKRHTKITAHIYLSEAVKVTTHKHR